MFRACNQHAGSSCVEGENRTSTSSAVERTGNYSKSHLAVLRGENNLNFRCLGNFFFGLIPWAAQLAEATYMKTQSATYLF